MIIPDNLRSAITKSDRYEPVVNRTFEDFANHYGTFIIPARAGKPKDKALVEQSVQVVQREILAPLRNRIFFDLNSLNIDILQLLTKLNERQFSKREGSRESLFLEIEKLALKPLPPTRYFFKEWVVKLVAGQNHHVLINGHSYSVPFKYAREEVEAAIYSDRLEIFHKGNLIANHSRSFEKGGFTTIRDHMPPKSRHYFDSLDKDKLIERSKEIGLNVGKWSEEVFARKHVPPKIMCRTVLGALGLAKEFGKDRLDKICERGSKLNIYSYIQLRLMLNNGADRLDHAEEPSFDSHLPQDHENIRGAQSYV